jgi:oligopeptide transport system substrate-binding protein
MTRMLTNVNDSLIPVIHVAGRRTQDAGRRTVFQTVFHISTLLLVSVTLHAAEWKDAYRPHGEAWKSVDQHLIIHNEAEPETIDPGRSSGVLEDRIERALFEGLTILHPKTLTPEPGAAESWTVSPDGLTYTFTLRAQAVWSDGVPVTASDFVNSWSRVIDPTTACPYADLIDMVVGARAIREGKPGAPLGVVAADPQTLVVTLVQPCPWFLELCAFHTLLPIRKDVIAQHGDRWTRPENLIGNGPFRLQTWAQRERIEVVKSATYWDRDFVKLSKLTFLPYDDLETAYKLFLAGDVHWVPGVPPAKLDEIRMLPDYYAAPYYGTYFYRLNVTKPPLDNVHVRRAISWAIDRRQITEHVTRAGQTPSSAWCPAGTWYQPVAGPSHDIERARKELALAGYGPGLKELPPIELLYNTSESHKLIAETVSQQLKQALGITVVARNCEWKAYLAAQDNLEFSMCRAAWIGDFGDPDTFFTCFLSGSGNNRTGWANPTYDDLVRRSEVELDVARRQTLLAEAETLLVDDECPIIGIYTYVAQGLLAEDVMGWEHNLRDLREWRCVWLAP